MKNSDICDDIARTLFSSPDDAPDTMLLRKLIWQELDAALSELPPELPPEQSEVFCLTVFDGLPMKVYGTDTPSCLT